jgi:hypothetical protein
MSNFAFLILYNVQPGEQPPLIDSDDDALDSND